MTLALKSLFSCNSGEFKLNNSEQDSGFPFWSCLEHDSPVLARIRRKHRHRNSKKTGESYDWKETIFKCQIIQELHLVTPRWIYPNGKFQGALIFDLDKWRVIQRCCHQCTMNYIHISAMSFVTRLFSASGIHFLLFPYYPLFLVPGLLASHFCTGWLSWLGLETRWAQLLITSLNIN